MKRLALGLSLLLGCLTFPVRAEMIIVAVSGFEELLPGQQLDQTTPIIVPKDGRITLLSKSGEIRVIDGPFKGVVSLKSGSENSQIEVDDQWDAMRLFLGQPDARSEVLGVTRGVDGEVPPPPHVWHVSIDSSGPRCTQFSGLTLWRRNAESTQTISIRNTESSLKELSWAAGEETLKLPDSFTVAEGRMIVSIDGDLREIQLHVFPRSADHTEAGTLLNWLVEKDCKRQAWSLVRQIHLGNARN